MAVIKKTKAPNPRRGLFYRWLLKIFLLTTIFWLPLRGRLLFAHPMPNSVVLLNIHKDVIDGEIQLPLGELQSAIGLDVNDNAKDLVKRLGGTLKTYLLAHIRPTSFNNKPWLVTIGEMKVVETQNKITGDYKELVVDFVIKPPQNEDLRNFYFQYDAIVHQVITHKILVAVKQDWEQGIVSEEKPTEVGVIELDVPSGKILPFQVSLQQGSTWIGFKSMVSLGMKHISEGTDHLLFLLTLLLPATLLVENKRWSKFGGTKYSLVRLLKIITAFTVGHSLTLIIGTLKWVDLPSQPIEILIAISILISAIHALRPIFDGKEVFIAGGFGLIHGLAFAETLRNLHLGLSEMVLSILGFNVGIELMQLMIMAFIIPWLIVLSKTQYYSIFRTAGAVLVSVAAFAWIAERVSGQSNFITSWIETLA